MTGIVQIALSCSVYIGSSWGRLGVQNRVVKGKTVRNGEPSRVVYQEMEQSGAITHFNCLFNFRTIVSAGLVLLTKAVFCTLFATYNNDLFHKLAPCCCLPAVKWSKFLNRSSPLKDYHEGNSLLGLSTTLYKRLRILQHCWEGGP